MCQTLLRVFAIAICLLFLPGRPVLAQEATPTIPPTAAPLPVGIQSPLPGQALQGSVVISGSFAVPDFQSAELAFAYADNPTGTWFLIQRFEEPINEGTLAQWDTSTITDGIYSLRLTLTLQDGSQSQVVVPGLRVRNYTPVETNTPTPVTPTATLVPGDTPVPSITPTPTETPFPPRPTALPINPVELSTRDINLSIGKGALATFGAFALIGLYALIRRTFQR